MVWWKDLIEHWKPNCQSLIASDNQWDWDQLVPLLLMVYPSQTNAGTRSLASCQCTNELELTKSDFATELHWGMIAGKQSICLPETTLKYKAMGGRSTMIRIWLEETYYKAVGTGQASQAMAWPLFWSSSMVKIVTISHASACLEMVDTTY